MVAKIKTGKSLIGALNYNEQKVQLGTAKLIVAHGYLKDADQLNFYDKLGRLEDLTLRNQRTQVNTLHVSLNFANGEPLTTDLMQEIADDYMEGLGFGAQPYLVYQHFDAGHPHIHIVTTNIKANGKRISLHHLANNASESSRKAIEEKYNLVRAEDQKKSNILSVTPLTKAEYGKAETKRMITNIVNEVARQYKFTSMPELNAVLSRFNIIADQGAQDSLMFNRKGLVYWVLDSNGQKIGVPIKASSIYGKPTLSALEEKFELNKLTRAAAKVPMITDIDKALSCSGSERQFLYKLSLAGIQATLRRNAGGRLYGVTFVDHNRKVVFNGSDLGKAYSANMLSAKFNNTADNNQRVTHEQSGKWDDCKGHDQLPIEQTGTSAIEILLKEEFQDYGSMNQFKRRKRRKGQSI